MLQFSNPNRVMEADTILKNGRSSKNKRVKESFFLAIMSLVTVMLSMVSCGGRGNAIFDNGDKILIVEIQGENVNKKYYEYEDVSGEDLIKESLEKGGFIILNVDIIKKIDNEFGSKYTVSDYSGKYYTRPAILNFVGGQGWHLLQVFGLPGNPQYFFTKAR